MIHWLSQSVPKAMQRFYRKCSTVKLYSRWVQLVDFGTIWLWKVGWLEMLISLRKKLWKSFWENFFCTIFSIRIDIHDDAIQSKSTSQSFCELYLNQWLSSDRQNDILSHQTGLDWTGLDWTGLDWTGLDWTGLD